MTVKSSKRPVTRSPKVSGTAAPVVAPAAEVQAKVEPVKTVTEPAPVAEVVPAEVPKTAIETAPVVKAAPVVEAKPEPVAPVAVKAAVPVAAAKPVKAKRAPARKATPKKIAPVKAPVKTAPAKIAKPVVQAAKAVVTPAVKVAETVQKEIKIMATKFELPKFDAPKVFSEVNEKTKAAVEKTTKLVEEFNDFAKGNVEAIVESSKIAAKGLETLGQDAADYNRKSFEGLTSTLKSFASVKSPTDFFKLQSDYVRSAFDAAVAQGSKNTEALIKLAGDASQPLSNRFAVAAEKVKATA